jgi:hypothetical protein
MKSKLFILAFLCAAALAAASVSVTVAPCLVTKGMDCWINWSVSGSAADKVTITILHGAATVEQFADVPSGAGTNEKTWPVPPALASGEYTFRVTTADGLAQGETKAEIRDKGIITDPGAPSGALARGSSLSIGWRAYGIVPGIQPAYLDLYRAGTLVGLAAIDAMNSSHGCGRSTTWIVGDLLDPVTEMPLPAKAPGGSGYRIRIRNHAGSTFAESGEFSILVPFNPQVLKDRLKAVARIPVWPVPGCPSCGDVSLAGLWPVLLDAPAGCRIELWTAGRSLGMLAEAGEAPQRASRRIDFGDSFQKLKLGRNVFELRLFDDKGALLQSQPTVLNYKSQ